MRGARRHLVFTTMDPTGRERRASDLTKLIVLTVALIALGALAVPAAGFERSLARFATSLPSSLDGLWQLVADVAAIVALLLVVATLWGRRFGLLADLVVAAAVAVATTTVVGRIVLGAWPEPGEFVRMAGDISEFPAARLALTATVVMTAAPHLAQPLRRTCQWLIGLAAVAIVASGSATPTGVMAALVIAAAGTAGARLALGSSHARPSLDEVGAWLSGLGVTARSLYAADTQSPGRFLVDAVDDQSSPLVVKVYGRDADDTQVLRTAWRTLWYRGPVPSVSLGRLQQVEHEALMTLLARQAGVRTHEVIAAGGTPDGDAVLVLTSVGPTLAEDPTGWSDEVARDTWRSLDRLHACGIAHGRLDDRHLVASAPSDVGALGAVAVVDFHGATVRASADLAPIDRAQALVTTTLGIGADRAVELAMAELGPARLDEVVPFVQLPSLTRRQRSAVKADDLDLDDLRGRALELTGGEVPELRKLQRITARTVAQFALLIVAFTALFAAFGGIDFSLLWSELGAGIWWLVLIGLVVAQVARVPAAVSTVGASPRPIPLGPVYVLQLALAYIGLAVPGSAARFAVNVRFLQRQGLPAGGAIAVSGLDSVFWFIVQIALVVGILTATPLSLDLDLGDGASGSLNRLVTILGGVAVVAIAVLLAVPRWRRPLFDLVRRLVADARQATTGLGSFRRLGMLLGGNLMLQLLLALALGAFARSLGHPVGFVELLLINVSVSLLAGLLPIPGGIGVVEGGLTFGLVRAGLPEETAFAVALLYRIATFYLPPLWGFFGLRWLERRQYL